ncbi:hypothetical protein APD56_03610 [Francisella orientalis]|nr:hypothetical protein BMT43_03720 [Francisella orientalis]OAM08270.1 hypothetical protein APD56_03610 [Francisella orientalis]
MSKCAIVDADANSTNNPSLVDNRYCASNIFISMAAVDSQPVLYIAAIALSPSIGYGTAIAVAIVLAVFRG